MKLKNLSILRNCKTAMETKHWATTVIIYSNFSLKYLCCNVSCVTCIGKAFNLSDFLILNGVMDVDRTRALEGRRRTGRVDVQIT